MFIWTITPAYAISFPSEESFLSHRKDDQWVFQEIAHNWVFLHIATCINIITTNNTVCKSLNNTKPTLNSTNTHMSKRRSSCHDCSLVDGHCILSIIRDDSMSRFMVSGDGFVFLINFHTSTFRSLNGGTINELFVQLITTNHIYIYRAQSSWGTSRKQN